MTTTYYASVNDYDTMADVAHAGTSSTSTDIFELRMGNGTKVPAIWQVRRALKVFDRWLQQMGLDQAGANLPPPTTGTGM